MLYSISVKISLLFCDQTPSVADRSFPCYKHHLSATGMRDQLRQCRIEAESADFDAGASRSHTPVHSSVHLKKNNNNNNSSSFLQTLNPDITKQDPHHVSPAVCAHQRAPRFQKRGVFHSRPQKFSSSTDYDAQKRLFENTGKLQKLVSRKRNQLWSNSQ